MKIAYQQLENHLKKNISLIYIVSSDELLLVQDAVDLIYKSAQTQGYTERTLLSFETNAEWNKTFFSLTHSMSLFASKKLIEINMHQSKFNANTTKSLLEYAAQPSQDTIVVIRTNKVDGKTEKSVWFKTLEKNSIFVPIWPITATQVPHWLMQRAKKMGVSLSKQTIELIATQTEGNLLAAVQELEKLHLLQLPSISSNDTTKSKTHTTPNDSAQFTIFDLVESIVAGNKSRAHRILHNLAAEDTEPTLVLWALTRELRMLADMQAHLKQGITLSSLFNKFHIYEKRQQSIRGYLQRHTKNTCMQLLLQAAEIDRIIKGAQSGRVWDEFEKIILAV